MVSRKYMVAFLLVTLGGVCLHFLYDFFPAPITALFGPVRESIWEHVKLIYWPYLIFACLWTQDEPKGHWQMHLSVLLIMCVFQTLCGWIYHIALGQDGLPFDLSLYVLTMGIGFGLSSFLKTRDTFRSSKLLPALAILLGILIVVFTFFPPNLRLFADAYSFGLWI